MSRGRANNKRAQKHSLGEQVRYARQDLPQFDYKKQLATLSTNGLQKADALFNQFKVSSLNPMLVNGSIEFTNPEARGLAGYITNLYLQRHQDADKGIINELVKDIAAGKRINLEAIYDGSPGMRAKNSTLLAWWQILAEASADENTPPALLGAIENWNDLMCDIYTSDILRIAIPREREIPAAFVADFFKADHFTDERRALQMDLVKRFDQQAALSFDDSYYLAMWKFSNHADFIDFSSDQLRVFKEWMHDKDNHNRSFMRNWALALRP
jgi:hypothetical protein